MCFYVKEGQGVMAFLSLINKSKVEGVVVFGYPLAT